CRQRWPFFQPPGRKNQVEQIQSRVAPGEDGFSFMGLELPPAQLDPEKRGARAEPHVGESQHGHADVIAHRMVVDTRGGERCEAGVLCGGEGGRLVVVVEKLCGFDYYNQTTTLTPAQDARFAAL